MWSRGDVSFEIDDTGSSDPVVTINVHTPAGTMVIMGEPKEVGRTLVVAGVHAHGQGVGPNGVGLANLRLIADVVMETLDYDELVVEGEVRTTGATPGRRPKPIRFSRGPGPAAQPQYAVR